jgi:hypothetical protein
MHCAERHLCGVIFLLSVTNKPIILSVFMLSVFMLIVILLNAVARFIFGTTESVQRGYLFHLQNGWVANAPYVHAGLLLNKHKLMALLGWRGGTIRSLHIVRKGLLSRINRGLF